MFKFTSLAFLFCNAIVVLTDEIGNINESVDLASDNTDNIYNNQSENGVFLINGNNQSNNVSNFDLNTFGTTVTNTTKSQLLTKKESVDALRILPKIVNGLPAPIEEFPYSAFIDIECSTFLGACTGSIISRKLILTAAHCVELCETAASVDIEVRVGSKHQREGYKVAVEKYFIHEAYSTNYPPYKVINDIAILLLRDELSYSSNVQRVHLSKKTAEPGLQCVLAGWGATDVSNKFYGSHRLYALNLTVWNQRRCEIIVENLPPKTFCAGAEDTQQYPYKGDSGAGIVSINYETHRYTLVGVHSLIKSDTFICVFVDTSKYYDWITSKINDYLIY